MLRITATEPSRPQSRLLLPQAGSLLHRSASMPACNVRLLLLLPSGDGLLCVAGDGALLTVNLDAGTLLSSAALPGTPAAAQPSPSPAAAAAPATVAVASGSTAVECLEQGSEADTEANGASESAAAAVGGLDFLAEAGYRGHRQEGQGQAVLCSPSCCHWLLEACQARCGMLICASLTCPTPHLMLCREGYLFRQGALGAGYYRKDVVRRYCASAAAAAVPSSSPAATNTCATGSGGGAGASGDASLVGQEQQEQQEQQEAAEEEARQYIQRLLQAPPSMHSVVASTSAGLLFTSSLGPSDSSIRVWQLPTHSRGSQQPELHRTLTGHTAPVLSLVLSPDGHLLFSGSYDQTIRVWSTADWHCLRVLKGHGGGVRAVAVAPDGGTLYSAAADNTIRVGACLDKASQPASQQAAAFWMQVLVELQALTVASAYRPGV